MYIFQIRIQNIKTIPKIISACLFFFCTSVYGQAIDHVYFAGFSYATDFEAIQETFPLTYKLNVIDTVTKTPVLDAKLMDFLQKNNTSKIHLNFNELAKLDSGNSIVLSLALENETVYVEPIGDNFRLVAELSAQALYFDFDSMTIIGAFPITVQYIHASAKPIKEKEKEKIIHDLYSSEKGVSLFAEFAKHLDTVNLKRKYNSTIQVGNVSVGEAVKEHLPQELKVNSRMKSFVAQSFSKFLSSNQQVSVLPYSKGSAIGGKMTARFADGRVYSLNIPEADYIVDLELPKLLKMKFSENNVGTSWIYGSYINFKLLEPLSGKIYADMKIKNGVTKETPAAQTYVEDWPVYQESLFVLFDKLTKEITKPTSKWAKSHTSSEGSVEQLKKVKEIIEKCK